MSAAMPEAAAPQWSSVRLIGTLAFAGLAAGVVLVGVYELTLPQITANRAAALERAVLKVVPGATSMRTATEAAAGAEAAGEREPIYAAFDSEGAFRGWAIPGAGPGFQDTIGLLYGFDPERGRITGMEILESRETPGLGDKIYKDEAFVGAFHDLAVDPEVKVTKPGTASAPNEVDAITGATISSKAVVKIINTTHARWRGAFPIVPEVPPPAPSGKSEPAVTPAATEPTP